MILTSHMCVTDKTAEVLRLVKAGTPWAGRSKAGRSRHLGQLFDKGLLSPDLLPFSWKLTEEGEKSLAAADLRRAERKPRARFCYLCRSTCSAEDHCAGCGKTICDDCDTTQPIGKHAPEAHSPYAKPVEQGK